MSNFGKIKNIWKLDAVSRSEYETSLKEFDDALTDFDNKLNTLTNTVNTNSTNIVDLESKHNAQQTEIESLKTLTTIKLLQNTQVLSNTQEIQVSNHNFDFTKPIYVSYRRLRNNSGDSTRYIGMFSFVVFLTTSEDWRIGGTNLYLDNGGTNYIEIGDQVALGLRANVGTKTIRVRAQCWNTNQRIDYIALRGTPLSTTTYSEPKIEIKEVGEKWEISS